MLHSHSAIRAGTPQRLASKLSFYARERQFYAHAAAFDHLESHPVDPALIKFADFKGPKKRRILVATPLCLVAQVTSSTDVDYDLLSDFFMTFRQFMKKRDLVELLHDRFLWAAGRPGNTGTTVRVRVFVAFRHWILNYMAEDFVSDYSMRAEFCSLINDLYNSLFEAGLTGPKGLHQIAELKRCWREFISIYFNDPVGDHDESPNAAIHPGGRPGSHQEVWDNALSGEGQLNGTDLERWVAAANARYQRSKTEPAAIIPPIQHGQQPSTNTGTTARMTTITTAPTLTHSGNTHDSVPFTRGSEKSVQVLSCSIPFRPMHRGDHGDEIVLYRQPPPRTVALPRQVISPLKANRPNVAPRKVESVPEGLGQPRPQAEQTESSPTRQETQDTTTSRSGEMYLPTFPGDLVKGRTIQPLAPDITYWNTNSFLISDREASPGSGPGVRRIFGTVRRALSHKQTPDPGQRDRHGDHLSIVGTSDGPPAQEAPSLSSSGHSVSRTTKSLSSQLVKEPRADFLGDRALDNFNKAIAVGLARYGGGMSKGRMPQTDVLRSNKALPQLPPLLRAPPRGGSHRRDMSGNVTMGSRSIVIMHEGLALNPPQTEKTTSGAIVTSSPVAENEEPYHVTTPTIIRTFFDDGEVLHGDDVDEVEVPVEFSGQDSWYKDEDEQADQYVPSGRSGLASSNVIPSHETSISGNGSALAKEIEATLGHQHVSSIEDPVLPDDPQPVRSLRRRHGGNLRQAIPDFEMDEDLVRPPAPEPWDSDEDEIFEQELATPSPASHLSLVPAEDYPQLLPEALEAPEAGAGILGVAVQEQLKSILFPDDPNEDGSPTAALMKLEGRYVSPLGNVDAGSPLDAEFPSPSHHYDDPDQERYRHRHEHVMDANQPIHELRPSAVLSRTSTAVSERERHRHNVSEASYSSIPLLERGLADTAGPGGSRRQHVDSDSSNSMANFRFPAERRLRAVNPDAASADGESLEHVERTPSLDRITHGDTVPLDVELAGHDRNDSADLASEDGLPVAVAGRAVRSFYEDEAVVGAEEFAEDDYDDGGDDSVFEHPMRHPSTPPPTAGRSPGNVHGVRMSNGLPTPAQSPTANRSQAKKPVPNYSAGVYVPRGSNVGHDESGPQLRIDPPMRPKKHSPFFLKLNPKRMAEAMTLVEQSALAQVNWRELIELSWSKSGLDKIRDWASFVLPTSSSSSWQPPKSVDIIIARFNVVLKWAVSEIVLTEDLSERRSTIRHYIRIAAAARDMRNFATMYQLTMALLSADVSGLKETWHFVPAEDKALLKGLEKLVTPQKNFAMLRREQEGVVVDKGCIPFFGEYNCRLWLSSVYMG